MTATVIINSLNLRAGPGITQKVLSVLHKGNVLQVIGRSGNWLHVAFNAFTGWVGANYVLENTTAVPPEPVPARPVMYKQSDVRWARVPFTSIGDKSQTISSSGCGIVCAAMIVATWKDKKITPVDMARLAVAHGYRTPQSGTAWAFFPFLARQYGWKCTQYNRSGISEVLKALHNGALVVCNMGPGLFTKGGHYILAWADDGKNIVVNDPARTTRDRGPYAVFKTQTKQFFVFTKS